MSTTVTENVDPLKVDVEDDITIDGVRTVTTFTEIKLNYLDKLNTEKDWIVLEIARMQGNITSCNARNSELDNIITAVNGF